MTVATDGSVRGQYAGFGWLDETGKYGLTGFRQPRRLIGPESVLITELRAIDAAVRAHPDQRLLIVSDSLRAVEMAKRWMRGKKGLPNRYTTDRRSGRTAGLVNAQRRLHQQAERIDIQWAPGHCGEPLNEGADALARLARRYAERRSGLTKSEYKVRAQRLAEAFAQESARQLSSG